jgi:hypothetical protein
MNDDDKYTNLLKLVEDINKKIDDISERIAYFNYLLYKSHRNLDIMDIQSREEVHDIAGWLSANRKQISATTAAIKDSDIGTGDANLFISMNILRDTNNLLSETRRFSSDISKLTGKSLLSSCNCGGPLQLLMEDDLIYLTCQRCGRWLWQGLKHV